MCVLYSSAWYCSVQMAVKRRQGACDGSNMHASMYVCARPLVQSACGVWMDIEGAAALIDRMRRALVRSEV